MSKVYIPDNYNSKLDVIKTEIAIKEIKDFFEKRLAKKLDLIRISAPLFVKKGRGYNDNLNGVERPVSFDMLNNKNDIIEIVHSLAKWKRMALKKYEIDMYKGIYADMNAIRRDEELDNTHSIYVDQWDWEKVINKEDRNLEYLKEIVKKIYNVLLDTEEYITILYDNLEKTLSKDIYFLTTQELEDMYPDLTPKEREDEIVKKYGSVFLMQIGKTLKSGQKHDGRAPDYDDWELNGDILVYNKVLDKAFEISSMGIRVDEESLYNQLKLENALDRLNKEFHKELYNKKLPYTIGGGLGQSRICMLLLQKAHIGEVQASVWTDEIEEICSKNNIKLL